MSEFLTKENIVRAFRAAERALASGDPDTLAGRFSPRPLQTTPAEPPVAPHRPRRTAKG